MNKQVLIPIRPEHAVNILNGKKTIELRKVVLKWVLEEIKKGNTVIFNMYVTRGKPYYEYIDWENGEKSFYEEIRNVYEWNINGKVVASFEVSKIEGVKLELIDRSGYDEDKQVWFETPNLRGDELEVMSYVSQDEMEKYFTNEVGYALYISNLKIFDTPKELIELTGITFYGGVFETLKYVTKTPKNMMTVFGNVHDDN
jgi:predicted transcriptional regulator